VFMAMAPDEKNRGFYLKTAKPSSNRHQEKWLLNSCLKTLIRAILAA